LGCHERYDEGLAGSGHEISTATASETRSAVFCVDCHDGWAAHLEDASAETITRPDELPAAEQSAACASCHLSPHQVAMAGTDAHAIAGLACNDCHRVHNNTESNLTLGPQETFCLSCHNNVAAEFRRQSAHPLEAGSVACTDCHAMGSLQNPMTAVGFDWSCQECHSELSGPFLHEHPVTQSHLVNGSGCVECHEPHGSANDRLLRQPNNSLCNQCHAVPPGHRLQHAGLGARLACVDCHSEIHGSNDNRLILDPLLGTKLFPDCYQSGCHAIGN